MLLMIQQMSPRLWSSVQKMSVAQRDAFLRGALLSVVHIAREHTLANDVLQAILAGQHVPRNAVTLLRAFSDEMDRDARGAYQGEPELKWLPAFRKARCALALAYVLSGLDSDANLDGALYELAHAHSPKEDEWIAQITVDALNIAGASD